MSTIRNTLQKYFDILEGERNAQYVQSKYIPVPFTPAESTTMLWEKHDKALHNRKQENTIPEQSLLDLKIELAHRIFHECVFCERRCKVDRQTSQGNCGVKEARITSEFLHFGEESVLVPSHTIFFAGCTFHCVFCQNWDISQQISGLYVEPAVLATIITRRRLEGTNNVNWVGGDPTSNLFYILTVLKECNINIPQIWNSNMYLSEESMRLLNGVIDVYLTDFKYGNNGCAQRLSKVENYTEIIQRNHRISYQQGEMIIRHLVMPGHTKCCSEPIIQWIQQHTPEVTVNIMDQYRPEYHACEYADIAHPLSKENYRIVVESAEKNNLVLI
jgi:putative pyruvate formate lyase activating enzyme